MVCNSFFLLFLNDLSVSNSFGGKKVLEEKGCQAVPIKMERMDEEAESSTTNDVQDFDIYSAMEWNNGVGSLPGSDFKVCIVNKVMLMFSFRSLLDNNSDNKQTFKTPAIFNLNYANSYSLISFIIN